MTEEPKIDFNRPGRMMSGSKRGPEGELCVWNANVCTKSKGKIWFGDINVTSEQSELQRLAKEQGEDVFVLREMDARFQHEDSPRYDRAVAVVSPNGTVSVST